MAFRLQTSHHQSRRPRQCDKTNNAVLFLPLSTYKTVFHWSVSRVSVTLASLFPFWFSWSPTSKCLNMIGLGVSCIESATRLGRLTNCSQMTVRVSQFLLQTSYPLVSRGAGGAGKVFTKVHVWRRTPDHLHWVDWSLVINLERMDKQLFQTGHCRWTEHTGVCSRALMWHRVDWTLRMFTPIRRMYEMITGHRSPEGNVTLTCCLVVKTIWSKARGWIV